MFGSGKTLLGVFRSFQGTFGIEGFLGYKGKYWRSCQPRRDLDSVYVEYMQGMQGVQTYAHRRRIPDS